MAELSEHDSAILNCVFNPHLPLEQLANQPLQDIEEDSPEIEQSKQLEIDAINKAENGDLVNSLTIINRAIEITPNRPSLYNNRAHIYQYQRKFDEAIVDITKAIELATNDVDKYRKTLTQAYCQRGILHKCNQRLDEARNDFGIAAKYGSMFAKSQLVEMNPYAALCNQMLRKVMEQI